MTDWLPEFEYPQLLILCIPALLIFRRWGRARGVTGWLRAALVLCLVVALSGPYVNLGGRGLDVVVLVDRSRSMPESAAKNIRELIDNLERRRGAGDRTAVVAFGSDARET